MATAAKDTVYIDVEDEITAVIEKVVSSKRKIVALVLPKRANVFMSIVNLKLLKKAAKGAGKSLVLITSDSSVIPIAAASGLHVAKTLTSKPEIPEAVAIADTAEETLAMSDAKPVEKPSEPQEETIELDNTAPKGPTEKTVKAKAKKPRRLMSIPDFSNFRLRVALGVLAIIVLGLSWFMGFVVMPKATVTVNTDTSTTTINTPVTLSVAVQSADLDNKMLPASRVQVEKIDKVKVPATGQKNIGKKASGTMTLTNCIRDYEKKIIPAGTTFSRNGVSFVTTEQVTLNTALYDLDDECVSADYPGFGAQKNVNVIAANPGNEYNIEEGSYNSSISGIRAYGSDMTGGSSEIIKVVSAEDVKKAEEQLKGASKGAALNELKKQLEEQGKLPLDSTLSEGTPKTVNTPAVDAKAEEVEVTMTITYALLGISDSDLSSLLDKEIEKNIGDQDKNVKDNGKDAVTIKLSNRSNEAETVVTVETVATLGPDIDEDALRNEIAGKRRGEIEKYIESMDGVRSVSVEYSPGWVTTTPKSAEKIRIVLNESGN